MFKLFRIFVPLFVLLLWVGGYALAGNPSPTKTEAAVQSVPKAVFPEVQHTFEPVYEGVEIKHDFVVENHGDAPLIIQSIRPD